MELPGYIRERLEDDPDTGCVRWTGSHTKAGYGEVVVPGSGKRYVHRVVYEFLVGPIPVGLTLDHVAERGCAYRDCANVDHLEPVTQGENARRGQHRRWATTAPPAFVAQVRAATGTQAVIGRRFGISQQHVSAIKAGKVWSSRA